jgi:bifunctional UDP-N-acetylglucosamine pyrophosphorylase/glucosamine-1-phosphate N-acetyltransferase
MLTAPVDVPGIVVRGDDGRVARVVEASDASEAELAIEERNTGVYLIDAELLFKTLAQVGDGNEQGEIYLTSIVEILVREGRRVEAVRLADPDEALGINTLAQLARAEAVVRARVIAELQDAGVTIVDPSSTWIDVDVRVGRDTRIEPGCVIQGDTRIGERCHLRPHCVIESSELHDEVTVGPSAHLRAGTRLGRGARIGNFVEVKNSVLGEGVKADHLAYIGDADVGDGVSFGCGAITVNYDWRKKHRTVIGAGAAIGCNANLVAPVTIGRNASVAAGSTITSDVPDGALAVARAGQRMVSGWSERRPPKAVASSAGAPGAAKPTDEKPRKRKAPTRKAAAKKAPAKTLRKKKAGKKKAGKKKLRKKAARAPASRRRR